VVVHYKSKTALLEEALVGDIREAMVGLVASIPEGADLLARFMHLSKGMLRFYDRDRNLYRALVKLTIFEPVSDTPGMTKQSEEYVQFLAKMVEEEKAAGVSGRMLTPCSPRHRSSVSILALSPCCSARRT
jgi:AcrR family transcriptional regulator